MIKNLTLLILILLFFQVAKAQVQKDTSKSDNDVIFAAVEQEPSFPDGAAAFNKFLNSKIDFSKKYKENGEIGKAIVTFVVEKDGTLTNIKALRFPNKDIVQEYVRVISLSPRWNPGIQNGLPVRVQYTIACSYHLPDE
jgi:protein TonB